VLKLVLKLVLPGLGPVTKAAIPTTSLPTAPSNSNPATDLKDEPLVNRLLEEALLEKLERQKKKKEKERRKRKAAEEETVEGLKDIAEMLMRVLGGSDSSKHQQVRHLVNCE